MCRYVRVNPESIDYHLPEVRIDLEMSGELRRTVFFTKKKT